MISAALEGITSRKWLVELLLAAAVVAGFWWFCHHLVDVGVQRERAAWMLKVDEANLKAAEAKGRAAVAEETGKKEHNELTTYVSEHPLHGSLVSLCKPTRLPNAAEALGGDVGAGASGTDVQPLPSGDPGSDEGAPDQLGMLSLLATRADQVSAVLREFQSR